MRLLRVSRIQRGCVHDGPGVRTTVFLKGCVLRCPWCCNPELISFEPLYFIDDSKCLLSKGELSKLCDDCIRNKGSRPITSCPFEVATVDSLDYEVDYLLNVLLKDKALYDESNGGVTFSGGEPMLWSEELKPLLMKLNSLDINLAFETTLLVSAKQLKYLLPYISIYLIDLKLQPQLYLDDINYLKRIKNNLIFVGEEQRMFRMVYVDDMQFCKEKILQKLLFLGVKKIEILQCHNLGKKKYLKLQLPNNDFSADSSMADLFTNYLRNNQINANLLTL